MPVRSHAIQAAAERSTRIGMLTPSSNTVLEPVCAAMLRGLPDVSLHVSRFRATEISLEASALGQFADEPMLAAACLLADARVHAICWNGTSASWLGIERDRALCAAILDRTGVPATTAVLAMLDALHALDLRRVGLVTPYTGDVQDRLVDTLTREGLSVVAERHSGLSENFAFANVSEADLTAMVEAVKMANSEAILVLCTNLRAGPLVPELERRLGITVLDSVGTALWDALRVAGVPPEGSTDGDGCSTTPSDPRRHPSKSTSRSHCPHLPTSDRALNILLLNPNTTTEVTDAMVAVARVHAAPGTEVLGRTAPRGVPYIASRAEAQIGGAVVLEMLADEEEPFDAAIVAAFADPGLGGARELMDVPVVGMAEAAMLTACMLGRSFAIVTFTAALEPWYRECVDYNRLAGRLACE